MNDREQTIDICRRLLGLLEHPEGGRHSWHLGVRRVMAELRSDLNAWLEPK